MFLGVRQPRFWLIGILLAIYAVSAASVNAQREKNARQEDENRQAQIKVLIQSLRQHPWAGAQIVGNPMEWDFGLSEPMSKILEIGQPAQAALLKEIDDSQTKAQVIFLLGGVGDEKAVEPIIDAMIPEPAISTTPDAALINASANLALTNITVADVIWNHGGGIVVDRCPQNPKQCWTQWWEKNKRSFSVKTITQSRRYSNYPGYGIYKGKN